MNLNFKGKYIINKKTGRRFSISDAILDLNNYKNIKVNFISDGGPRTYTFKELLDNDYYFEDVDLQKEIERLIKPGPFRYNLRFGDDVDKVAMRAYERLCGEFQWEISQADQFDQRRPLFAPFATPEGYHVLFLCHSNFTGTQSKWWKNTISKNYDIIIEEWFNRNEDRTNNLHKIRVVFAKVPKIDPEDYIFLGLYESVDIDYVKQVETFKRISNVYPLD